MRIAVVGTGYVGLVSGACFAEMGVDVYCVDRDTDKIDRLKRGEIPIYEEGLQELVEKNVSDGRLHFTTRLEDCLPGAEIVFIAVGTPPGADGSADLSAVFDVARQFGRLIAGYTLLVTKSTVPVGTAHRLERMVRRELELRGVAVPFDVASNPEFLKEGAAKKDFMMPDRVVIGVESEEARRLMSSLYRPFLLNNYRVIFMDVLSAEMTKYASNAMLATRISFINEIARLCELTGADVRMVRQGMATDSRIGNKFLYPGCGYGGSCFPKDVKALVRTAEEKGYRMEIIRAAEQVNEEQKKVVFRKLSEAFSGSLAGRRIALWGLAFKPGTDDVREAPSLETVRLLVQAGAQVFAVDPIAVETARAVLGDGITYGTDIYDSVRDADAIALVTEWKQFRIPDWRRIRSLMRGNVLVDGRNIYDREEVLRMGFRYYCIGCRVEEPAE